MTNDSEIDQEICRNIAKLTDEQLGKFSYLEYREIKNKINRERVRQSQMKNKAAGIFRCELCNISFRNSSHLQDHKTSQKHEAKMVLQKDPKMFTCVLCNVDCGVQKALNAHCRKQEHQTKMQQFLKKIPEDILLKYTTD